MMKIELRFLFPLIVALTCLLMTTPVALSQEENGHPQTIIPDKARAVFDDVQNGISTGDVARFVRHLAPRVAVNLRESEDGTFSSNQTYYVLQSFFKTRSCGRFEFSSFGESDSNPWANGVAESVYNGNKELVQVYVALTIDGEKYVITQLTIY